MSSLRSIVLGCVSDRGPEPSSQSHSFKRLTNAPHEWPKSHRVKFGVVLVDALKDDTLPEPLVEILVYLAREGVTTTDLFRRPGNSTDLKTIMKRLSEGREIQLGSYNFYTLASVIKKFLLKIPGGMFGPEAELQLLHVLEIENRLQQHNAIHSIISNLLPVVQKLMTLLFGTWFRIVSHSEYNTMSSESVAKSVAGSLFHTCADDPVKIERAVQILQILIDDFAIGKMFGHRNLQFFTEITRTRINVREKFRYEFNLPEKKSISELRVYFPLFIQIVEYDIMCRSFDPSAVHAITEEEFYSLQQCTSSSKPSPESSTMDGNLQPSSSSTPSPQSLLPSVTYVDPDPNHNPHKKLTHVSSLSAPEVNQGCVSPSDVMSPSSPCAVLSTSLSRFDSVRRRQLVRLWKRSHWFLSPNESYDGRSALSSFEASGGGISSMDPISSEAATSDGTVSDCVAASDAIHVSLDLDCAFDEGVVLCRSTDPVSRRLQVKQKGSAEEDTMPTVNWNLQSTQIARQHPSVSAENAGLAERSQEEAGVTMASLGQLSPEDPTVLQERTRHFMVESYYGTTTENTMQT